MKQFCENVDLGQVNRRVIESLVKSGAFDGFEEGSASMMDQLPAMMELGQARQRDREMGQSSLFDGMQESEVETIAQPLEAVEEWSDHDRLKFEKETLGFYVSGHPLNPLAWSTFSTSQR